MTTIEDVAFRLKIPKEKVELVVRSFHQGLSYYLNRPAEAKGGIRLDGFGTFKQRESALRKRIHKGTEKPVHHSILESIQKNRRKNARQKSAFLHHEGSND